MVARLTIGRKKYAEAGPLMERVLAQAEDLRAEMDAAVVVDAAAFEAVMEAFRLPKDTPEQAAQRNLMIEAATLQAAQSPLNVAKAAVAVMELVLQAASVGNLNAITDGATGAAMARAALTGAGYNLRINLKSLSARDTAEAMLAEMTALEGRADQIDQALRQTLRERADI
jgi:formiminotetrahydrofolate cyclodeaminase